MLGRPASGAASWCPGSSLLIALSLILLSTIYVLHRRSHRSHRSPPKSLFCAPSDHSARVSLLLAHISRRPPGSKLSLHHRSLSSNTIRSAPHKSSSVYYPLDLSSFDHIISISLSENYAIVEPGITFGELLPALLRLGVTPLVVPELPNITVGGAISGGALESSSHRWGQFSDTVLELECLTPDQRVVCSPEQNADLFWAVSASYNTVAVVTRVKIRIGKAPNFVHLRPERYGSWEEAVGGMMDTVRSSSEEDEPGLDGRVGQGGKVDTVEGIAFGPKEILVIRGTHTDLPLGPVCRFNQHWNQWYYKVIRDSVIHHSMSTHTTSNRLLHSGRTHTSHSDPTTSDSTLSAGISVPYADYCFRYNYGSFWMASYVLDLLGGDRWFTRFLVGWLLDTRHLFSVLHSSNLADLGRMRVIQDLYVPSGKAVEMLGEVERDVGVWPVWMCPVRGTKTGQVLACHHLLATSDRRGVAGGREAEKGGDPRRAGSTDGLEQEAVRSVRMDKTGIPKEGRQPVEVEEDQFFINLGIYGRPSSFPFSPSTLHSRLIDTLLRLGGRPMLYAQTWHTPAQFEKMYGPALRQVEDVRRRYGGDPEAFFGLYEKVSLSEGEREELGRPMKGTEGEEIRKVVWDIVRSKFAWGGA